MKISLIVQFCLQIAIGIAIETYTDPDSDFEERRKMTDHQYRFHVPVVNLPGPALWFTDSFGCRLLSISGPMLMPMKL